MVVGFCHACMLMDARQVAGLLRDWDRNLKFHISQACPIDRVDVVYPLEVFSCVK